MTGNGDMNEMPTAPPQLSCEQVDDEDLDTRYVRGELEPALALAFEAHYFGCDRCWKLVQQGNQVRSARSVNAGPSRKILWVAVAAVLAAVVGAGVWRELRRDEPEPIGAVRSGTRELAAPVVTNMEDRISLTWTSVPEAASYRVRLFGADGSLMLQREVADTQVAIPRDSVPSASSQLIWQVHVLNRLGNEIGRFPLTTARP